MLFITLTLIPLIIQTSRNHKDGDQIVVINLDGSVISYAHTRVMKHQIILRLNTLILLIFPSGLNCCHSLSKEQHQSIVVNSVDISVLANVLSVFSSIHQDVINIDIYCQRYCNNYY